MSDLHKKIVKKAEANFLKAKKDLIASIKDCLRYKDEMSRLNELCLADTYDEIVNVRQVKAGLKDSVGKMEEVFVRYASAQMVLAVAKCGMFKGVVDAKNSKDSSLLSSRITELVNYRYSFPLSDISRAMENMSEALDGFKEEGAVVSSHSEHAASDFVNRMVDSVRDFEKDSDSMDYALYLMQHYSN